MQEVQSFLDRIRAASYNIKNIEVAQIDFSNALFPFFERVHHALIIPSIAIEKGYNKTNDTVCYGRKATFWNERKKAPQDFYLRSADSGFQLLPFRDLQDMKREGRFGCFSFGGYIDANDKNQDGLLLVHVFNERSNSVDVQALSDNLVESFSSADVIVENVDIAKTNFGVLNVSCTFKQGEYHL